MKFLKSQRGAMFGLDARIAMAIIAALSLVGGIALTMTVSDVKAKALMKDLESYKAAVEALQYDVKANIQTITTSVTSVDAFRVLNDSSLLLPAYQAKWYGPYLKVRTNDAGTNENYGDMRLQVGTQTNVSAAGSCGSACYYWIRVDDVPYNDFMVVNEILDGANETNPDTSGRLQWRADNGGAPDRIFYMSGRVVRG